MDIPRLIGEMTLEEKAGLCSGSDFWHTKAVERLGVPAVMMSDGPHGLRKQDEASDHLGVNDSIEAVCFPAACATAASFDRALIRRMGEALGDSCRHERVAVLLGPAVNIKRSPLCGRNFEYYSEDPFLAGQAAAAFISGVQSRGTGTSIKHFAANSQEHRRMSSDSVVDERALREIYLPAFETAVKEAKPWTVMCSYNRLNGEFASQHPWLLTGLLRDEWGYDGAVVSDWGPVSDRVKGLAAGLDLEMPFSGGANDRRIAEAVKSGQLDEAVLDRACGRILTMVSRYLSEAGPDTPWDKQAQHDLAVRIAGESMVLLKNEDGVLPLRRDSKVAFIGEFAEKPRFQGGGSSHIHCSRISSALTASRGLGVSYARGYSVLGDADDERLLREAAALAAVSETAVVFAGLPDSYESEGYDRAHMRLPDSQSRLIEAVAAANPRTVVVLHNGSPVEMPWIGGVKAVLEAYLGGQGVGEAEVRVLYGDVNPSGHLAETFPLKLSDNPSFPWYGGEGDRTEYREGVFVGYRWYDKKDMPVLFPFGHGLSYTSFALSDLKLSSDSISGEEKLKVTVRVTNTGRVEGKAVPQLYVAPPKDSAFIRPVRELKGFEKVSLKPGESMECAFELDSRAFALWSAELHGWFVETGEYEISAGQSSREMEVSARVRVYGGKAPKRRYDMNSIMMDILSDPDAKAKIAPYLEAMRPSFADNDARSDAARDAITDDMTAAMIKYMPLRGLVSFGGGSSEELDALVRLLNE